MKTYHEMTESVLEKARADVLKKKRRRKNGVFIAASGLCAVLLLTAIGAGLKQTPTLPGEYMGATGETKPVAQQSGVKLSFLREVDGQTVEQPLVEGVIAPIDFVLRVRDVRGLDETEREAARREEWSFGYHLREKWNLTTPSDGGMERRDGRNAIITLVYNGFLYLDADYDQISSMSAETEDGSETNLAHYYFKRQTADGVEIRKGVRIFTPVSFRLTEKLEEDPTIPLSSLRDSITVTLTYKNGSEVTVIIDIMFDDEGNVYIMQRGDSYHA